MTTEELAQERRRWTGYTHVARAYPGDVESANLLLDHIDEQAATIARLTGEVQACRGLLHEVAWSDRPLPGGLSVRAMELLNSQAQRAA